MILEKEEVENLLMFNFLCDHVITGLDIINIALTYVNTPYQHQARLKGIGIDCAGLIVEVMGELGFNTSFDVKAYDRLPDGQMLARICHEQATPKEIINNKYDFENGDILLFNFLGNPQHLAFYYNLNNQDYFIHAFGDKTVNKVIIQRLDEKWKARLVGAFKIKGVE